tara:strand:- start:1923 stop:2600 length:678 start_codon:yes stop_codon:yes gene_type:complete
MVYKSIFKFLILIFFFLLPINLYPNIIYDKNNIIITKLDLENYKQLYFENYGEHINNSNALKNIIIIKNVIEYFSKNNPNILKKLDEILNIEIGNEMMNEPIVRDYMRYFKIRNEFIFDFYNTKFNIDDLSIIFNKYNKIELPISINNCLTISKIVNFKNNNAFVKNFYKNLREQKKEFETIIDNVKYSICIDSKTFQIFEREILKYIEINTKDDFEKFIYEQQK